MRLTPIVLFWLDVAMKQIKIAALKDHLSEHLRAVESGTELEVTDRRRPIVRMIPVTTPAGPAITAAHRPFSAIRGKRFRPADWNIRSLEFLLEERGKR